MMLSNRFKQLHVSSHFQVKLSFDFPKSIPACPGNAITFLEGSHLPYTSFLYLSSVKSFLLRQAGLQLCVSILFCKWMDSSVPWRGCPWQKTSFSKLFCPSGQFHMRTSLPACLPTLNKPKSDLLQSRVCYLPFSHPLGGVKYIENYQRSFLSVFVSQYLNCPN